MLQKAEILQQMEVWREKARAGTLTLEEQKQAIIIMRQSRLTALAAATPGKRAAKPKAPARSAEELFKDLAGI